MAKLNERKIRWIIQQKLRGRGTGELAMIQHVSTRRVKQLWQTYRRTGLIPTLKQPGRKPKPIRLEDATRILEVYDRCEANALILEAILKEEHGLKINHMKIQQVLRLGGRALAQPAKQGRRKWVRYEREHSMTLWHADWKQLPDGRWIIAYMDDASRLIISYGVFQEATGENTIKVLKEGMAKYGCPKEILTDRGSQFYANEGEHKTKGQSEFERFLSEKGIRHILCRVNHPQTNGKLERFYGVLDQKWPQFHHDVDTIIKWHNEIKPHMSLNWKELETPIKAFHRKYPPDRPIHTPLETMVKRF
jgi:putative transposase